MNAKFNCQASEINDFELSNVVVGDFKTNIEIRKNFEKSLDFLFSCGFQIHIDERGISFTRTVKRPDHDHDDTEYLYVEKGKLIWMQYRDAKDLEVFRMRFGPRTEGESE